MTNEPEAQEPTQDTSPKAETAKRQRTRRGRKRSYFRRIPQPAWPVRGLWEAAPEEAREKAHQWCIAILEYWLGKKPKQKVAEELGVSPLRVWQQSQSALSGMLAGLLPQPRAKVPETVFEAPASESKASLLAKIEGLQRELAATEDLVRVLRTAPWSVPGSESPAKGGASHATSRKRKATKEKGRPRGEAGDRGDAPSG